MGSMDKRRYVQRARAVSSEETRRRILAAARASLERDLAGALKVEEVAREAGVSRSTVYLIFGSRAGLFDVLARQLRDDAGFDRLVAAFGLPDALEAQAAAQRVAVDLYAAVPELARAVFALAEIDPDAVAAVKAIEDGRRPGQASIARRLAEQGYLRDDVSVEEATEILAVVSSFAAFDELLSAGLTPPVIADRLIAMAQRSIIRPDALTGTHRGA